MLPQRYRVIQPGIVTHGAHHSHADGRLWVVIEGHSVQVALSEGMQGSVVAGTVPEVTVRKREEEKNVSFRGKKKYTSDVGKQESKPKICKNNTKATR